MWSKTITVVAFVFLTVGAAMGTTARAQEATSTPVAPPGAPTPASDLPPGEPSSGPAGKVAAPEDCNIRPLRRSAINKLVGTPDASDASAIPSPTPVDPTIGEPADKETRAEIRATVRELAACNNAGEMLRFLAMFTPEYLERSLIRLVATSDEAYDLLSTPVPPPPRQQWGVVKVEQIRFLDDDRVRAVVTIDFPEQVGIEPPNAITFVKDGDRWLIDDISPVEDANNSD